MLVSALGRNCPPIVDCLPNSGGSQEKRSVLKKAQYISSLTENAQIKSKLPIGKTLMLEQSIFSGSRTPYQEVARDVAWHIPFHGFP